MLLSGVLIGRMTYRANEGGALVPGLVNYIKEIDSKLYKRDR
jgi:hypothetical protein